MRVVARLSKRQEDGAPLRAHLEVLAERGDPQAVASLEVPDCPEEMGYLLAHAFAVHGRSGSGFGGFNLLSNLEFNAYAVRVDWEYEPWEADAVFALDAALVNPEADLEANGEAEAPVSRPQNLPTRKRPDGVEPQFVTPIPT